MAFGRGRRVRRVGDGEYELRLPDDERAVLRTLPAQMRELLSSSGAGATGGSGGSGGGPGGGWADPSLGRLFPPAYLHDEDAEHDAEYRRFMHDELLARKLAAADVVESTIDQRRLSEDDLLAWMGALNDLRLVLGTRLDVTEDMDEPPADSPDAPAFGLYYYLGMLQEQVVAALDPEY